METMGHDLPLYDRDGFPIFKQAEVRRCPHGFHHPPWAHSCDGCWCEGERDQREYGWNHDTSPEEG